MTGERLGGDPVQEHAPASDRPSRRADDGEIRTLGRHALIYGAGNALAKLAGFLMLPIYTRYLTPSDFGTVELITMTIELISTLAGVGLAVSVFRFRAKYEHPSDKAAVMSTASIALTVMAVATATVGALISPALTRLVLGADGRPVYFQIFFLIYLATALETVPLLQLRAARRSVMFVTINLAKLVAMLSLNIYFVVILRMGIMGVLVSNALVTGASAAALSVYMYRQVGVRFHLDKLAEMVRYGYPMVFVFLGNFVLVFSDRYFLKQFWSTAEVGIYSLSYRFAFILSTLAANPFQQIWGPQRFTIAKRSDAKAVYARVFTYLNLVLIGVGLVIAMFARDVIVVMAAPAFWAAAGVVPVLIAAQVIHCWTTFNNIGFLLHERTSDYAKASTAGVIATLALNFLLIPPYGIWGAAWATLISYTVRFLAIHGWGQRYYPIQFEWGRIAGIAGIAGTAIGIRASLGALPLAPSVGVSALLVLLAGIAVYAWILTAGERRQLRTLWQRGVSSVGLAAPRG